MDQNNLLKNWEKFSQKPKPRAKEGKDRNKKYF